MQARNESANGPRRVQSKGKPEYSATFDTRQLSGYACTRKEHVIVKQGGTAEAFVLGIFCRGFFCMKMYLDVRWRGNTP